MIFICPNYVGVMFRNICHGRILIELFDRIISCCLTYIYTFCAAPCIICCTNKQRIAMLCPKNGIDTYIARSIKGWNRLDTHMANIRSVKYLKAYTVYYEVVISHEHLYTYVISLIGVLGIYLYTYINISYTSFLSL